MPNLQEAMILEILSILASLASSTSRAHRAIYMDREDDRLEDLPVGIVERAVDEDAFVVPRGRHLLARRSLLNVCLAATRLNA